MVGDMLLGAVELLAADAPIRLPHEFLSAFAAGGVATIWLDGCLAVWPRAEWAALAARIAALPLTEADSRTFARLVFSSAVDLEVDPLRPRLEVPAALLKRAGIEDRAVLVGAGRHAELWEPARWARVADQSLDDLALPAAV